jgi:CBS domain containing-hemolysin-like protein
LLTLLICCPWGWVTNLEKIQVREAMSTDYVKVHAMATIKEAFGVMVAGRQRCALVVDENDLLEGLITPSDLQREVLRAAEESVYSDEAIIVEVLFSRPFCHICFS